MLNNREAGREEEMWIVIKEQSLLAQKRNEVFQNFRYWFKPDTGQGVDLVCSVDSSLRSLWFRLRDSSPFSFTPGREFPEAELCVPPSAHPAPSPQPPRQTQRYSHVSRSQRLASYSPLLFIFPDVWNPFCFAVILHPSQTHFNIGSGPPFIMKSR